MNRQITTVKGAARAVIVPSDASKDTLHRLGRFAAWLEDNAVAWHTVDLAAYRDHMLASGRYVASSVSAHLSTIRARYRAIIRDRDLFYGIASQQTDDPLVRKAMVDETITRLENATDPAAAPVEVTVHQDVPDADQLRLTSDQASALMAAPGVKTLKGLRDTAVIALALCTGIREAELSALEVHDLRTLLDAKLSLHVRKGKGSKARVIPYGKLEWVLAIVDKWLDAAGIEGGPVFRGFYKGNRTLRSGRLSVRAIQYILEGYPIMVDGKVKHVRPHDLRRTYARRMYEGGMAPVAIQQNLGHADLKTTLGYIGDLDIEARQPPAVYSFDLNGLARAATQGRLDDEPC